MEISKNEDRGFMVFNVAGRLDAASAQAFEADVNAAVDAGQHKVIIDLAELEYISSAGLRSILALMKKVKGLGGSLGLCRLNGLVQEVLTMSGFDSFIPIYESPDAAMQAD
jgi:anti-sigma B factor antagonist